MMRRREIAAWHGGWIAWHSQRRSRRWCGDGLSSVGGPALASFAFMLIHVHSLNYELESPPAIINTAEPRDVDRWW
jgi:hypothetical protein